MTESEELENAVRRSLNESGCWKSVGKAFKRFRNWDCSDHEAEQRLRAMCSPNNFHRIQAALIPIVIRESRLDHIVQVQMRVWYDVIREDRENSRRDRIEALRRASHSAARPRHA